ncbi:MAG: hypothetical protein U1F68_05910 [Gammaproteobacteria bacterium]
MPNAAFIDTKAHPSALKHYEWLHAEPVVNGFTGNSSRYLGLASVYDHPNMTLSSLLKDLASFRISEGNSILFCCHGSDKALSLKLASGWNFGLDVVAIDYLLELLNGKAEMKQQADNLKTSEAVLKPLIANLEAVHKKKFHHVAIRACNIGKNRTLLEYLKRLFNARSISAPLKRDAYGPFKPDIAKDAKEFEAWLKKHPKAVVYNDSPDRLALRILPGSKSTTFKLDGMAERLEAVDAWIAITHTRFNKNPKYKAGTTIYTHGLLEGAVQEGKQLDFCMESGYLANIRYHEKPSNDPLDDL